MPEERQKGCCSFNSNGIRAVDGANPSTLADIGKNQGSNYSAPFCFTIFRWFLFFQNNPIPHRDELLLARPLV
jgi:hypothetical protein